ncbi:hypothetical protein TVNIR_2165 [Thioalkalivibrio nitratireducens DSM 14787]|uniref:Mn2+-dependent serine/threonine protein kinase n=1 Tax=Thioalkalivibrio nitratireducens (strain DSM 14787 / UNIQEM 213 / ALEN2) TaxID=1255043 RepID=L0DZK3_THIND|nr:hypothetical protein [Thioalkalivibrio nitratireducens]AGA33821.1 hypothetical protein TVNIR_2165 [Thioalkalivibrio nitratireducens DSM 14787]
MVAVQLAGMTVPLPPEFAIRCLKADGPRIVWLIHPPGESPQVLKTWPLNPRRFLTHLLGISAAQRTVRGNRLLGRVGIAVPELLSRPEIRFGCRGWCVDMRLSYVPGVSGWEVLQRSVQVPGGYGLQLRAVARSVGMIVGRLIRNGLFHRDLTIENFVIGVAGQVWIVDTDGVRPMRNRVRETERMLSRLAVQSLEAGMPLPVGVQRTLLRAVLRPLSRRERSALMDRLRQQPWVRDLQSRQHCGDCSPGHRTVPETP